MVRRILVPWRRNARETPCHPALGLLASSPVSAHSVARPARAARQPCGQRSALALPARAFRPVRRAVSGDHALRLGEGGTIAEADALGPPATLRLAGSGRPLEERAEVRVEIVALGARDQAVEAGGSDPTGLAADEEPVLAAEGHRAQGALRGRSGPLLAGPRIAHAASRAARAAARDVAPSAHHGSRTSAGNCRPARLAPLHPRQAPSAGPRRPSPGLGRSRQLAVPRLADHVAQLIEALPGADAGARRGRGPADWRSPSAFEGPGSDGATHTPEACFRALFIPWATFPPGRAPGPAPHSRALEVDQVLSSRTFASVPSRTPAGREASTCLEDRRAGRTGGTWNPSLSSPGRPACLVAAPGSALSRVSERSIGTGAIGAEARPSLRRRRVLPAEPAGRRGRGPPSFGADRGGRPASPPTIGWRRPLGSARPGHPRLQPFIGEHDLPCAGQTISRAPCGCSPRGREPEGPGASTGVTRSPVDRGPSRAGGPRVVPIRSLGPTSPAAPRAYDPSPVRVLRSPPLGPVPPHPRERGP